MDGCGPGVTPFYMDISNGRIWLRGEELTDNGKTLIDEMRGHKVFACFYDMKPSVIPDKREDDSKWRCSERKMEPEEALRFIRIWAKEISLYRYGHDAALVPSICPTMDSHWEEVNEIDRYKYMKKIYKIPEKI